MAKTRKRAGSGGRAKTNRTAKPTGRLRVRKDTAARTVRSGRAENAHTTEVRERINEAIKDGRQLRRQIEARIEAALKENRRR
jgi:hypothetical protein